MAILKDDGVRPVDRSDVHFKVQSQSSSAWYNVVVDLEDGIRNCSCPQHARLRSSGIMNAGCKHVIAAELWIYREYVGGEIPASGRPDNVRKHPRYNEIRENLPISTLELIRCLVASLTHEELIPRRHRRGRRPRSSAEVYANLLVAAASGKASREAVDPTILRAVGFARRIPVATRLKAMQDLRVRDALRKLLGRTAVAAGPARNFGQDSHHYRTPYSVLKYELRDEKRTIVLRAVRCKVHITIDTDKQLIVSGYVSNANVPDIEFFDQQVDDAMSLFGVIDTWHADNAYRSLETVSRIASLGGDPSYIEFAVHDKPNGHPIWDMALTRYRKREEENGPHPRSLVESVNNALRSHGHKVRARLEITRECEMLARMVVYNLRRLAYLHVAKGLLIAFADQRAMHAVRFELPAPASGERAA